MNELEFSRLVIERYEGSDDRIINIIIKLVDENDIEIENIDYYLTDGIKEILRVESEKYNVIEKEPEEQRTFNIF